MEVGWHTFHAVSVVSVPELKAAFVAVDLARREGERLAAGEVLRPVRRLEVAVRTECVE